jgi:hypothetical protein
MGAVPASDPLWRATQVTGATLHRRVEDSNPRRLARRTTPMMPEFSSAGTEWSRTKIDPVPPPPFRRLRGYAFDPSLSVQLETALVNEAVFKVPWEKTLERGPVGEYVSVVDFDPPSQCFYEPVDLNNPLALAQDGLPPSEGNPQFHQQMVYAVAMTTIRNFERALGRSALWSPRLVRSADEATEWAWFGQQIDATDDYIDYHVSL